MKATKYIISNRIKSLDGTILISRHVHDYVDHTDKQGNYIAVDGGHDYLRRAGEHKNFEELSVFSTDHFELIRNTMEWGSRGKDGKSPLHYVTLKCMSNNHIENILSTQIHINKQYKKLFKKELAYRIKQSIVIEDK